MYLVGAVTRALLQKGGDEIKKDCEKQSKLVILHCINEPCVTTSCLLGFQTRLVALKPACFASGTMMI